MGKKLRESVGAGRTLNIFGNNFNPFWASDFSDGANFPLVIDNPTTVFAMNASPFPQPQHGGHEVPTCFTLVENIVGPGSGQIRHQWFNSDNTLVFTFLSNFTLPAGGHRVSLFTFIGWVDDSSGKELFENSTGGATSTRCEIRVTGVLSPLDPNFQDFVINFDVTNASPNPMTPAKAAGKRGFMWVDDASNELMYVDGIGYVHNTGIPIESSVTAVGAKPGFIWIPSDAGKERQLAYTSTGLKHFIQKAQIEWVLTPISSTKHGFIWFQPNLRGSMISWIGNDGNRYAVGDGAQDTF